MKKIINSLFPDKVIAWVNGVAGLLLLIQLIALAILYRSLPPFVPVFNQLPWSEARLGDTWTIFIPGLIVFFFIIFNIFLSKLYYVSMPLISRMISITTFFVSIASLIFIIRTLQLLL